MIDYLKFVSDVLEGLAERQELTESDEMVSLPCQFDFLHQPNRFIAHNPW